MDGIRPPSNDDVVWTQASNLPPSPTPPVSPDFGLLPSSPATKPKRRLTLWLTVVVIVLLLGAGAAFAYTRGLIPAELLGGVSIDKVMDAMVSGQQSNSGSGSLTISLSSGTRDKDATQFPLDQGTKVSVLPKTLPGVPAVLAQSTPFTVMPVESPSLSNDEIQPLGTQLTNQSVGLGTADLTQSLWQSYANVAATLTADFGVGALDTKNPMMTGRLHGSATVNAVTYAFDLEGRMVDKKLYAKATTLPTLPFFSLEKVTGKWYVFDLPQEIMDQFIQNFSSEQASQQQADARKFLDAVRLAQKDTKFLFIEKTLGSEEIDGVKTKHIRLGFKPEKLQLFYQKFMEHAKALGVKLPQDDATERQFEQELAKSSTLDQLKAYAANAKHEFWIDLKSGQILGVRWTLRLVPPDSVSAMKDKQLNFTIESRTTGRSKPVTVQAPTDALPYTQFLNDVSIASFLGLDHPSDDTTSGDAHKDTDSDGLTDASEKVFGTDMNKIDTDGDGYSDKTEIDSGYDPLTPATTPNT